MANSASDIVSKVNYRGNAVFKKAGAPTQSLSRAGHGIWSVFDGQVIKRVRKQEAVKFVEGLLADGYELVSDIVTDVLP